jgi:tetratricopeptide (TPR) repeat protein
MHAGLGQALSSLHQTDAAIREFQTALNIDPNFVPALGGLAEALIDEKRYSAAIACLQNAPADETLRIDLGLDIRAMETLKRPFGRCRTW